MLYALQNAVNRERLIHSQIRRDSQLFDEADYRLLDSNLVVGFVNEDPPLWYDVHPLLREAVDRLSRE